MNCKKEYYRLPSTCGAPLNHTNVQPVDAHVWRQLHLSAVARFSDSYCIFLFFFSSFPSLIFDLVAICFILLSFSRGYYPVSSVFFFGFDSCSKWYTYTRYDIYIIYIYVPGIWNTFVRIYLKLIFIFFVPGIRFASVIVFSYCGDVPLQSYVRWVNVRLTTTTTGGRKSFSQLVVLRCTK